MKKGIIMWLGVLALTAVPALTAVAQEGPDEDGPEAAMSDEGGMPPGGPGMGMGMGQGMGPGMGQGMGPGMMGGRAKMMGGRGMNQGMRMGQGGPGFLSEDETIALIKKYDADFAKKVSDLKTIAPAKYRMLLQMSRRLFAVARMDQDENLEKDAVRGLSLEYDCRELAGRYDRASDAEKKSIKEALRAKSSELFDLKIKGQELRVKRMEKDIARLKKNLETRKANKAKIVDLRVDQMTGEGFGW